MEDGEDGITSELKKMEEEKKETVNKVAVKKGYGKHGKRVEMAIRMTA